MIVTIKKIAELSGVSRGTVDRALNNRGGVSSEVERRIKKIAKELDYKPNLMARALANSNKSISVGVLINSGGNPFFDEVLRGIEKAKQEMKHFNVVLTVKQLTGYYVEQQLLGIEELLKIPMDGFIITPINDKRIETKLNEINALGIPVVTLNADIAGIKKLAFVGCEYLQSGKTAGELIGQITMGKANVGVMTGSHKMLGHTMRVEGFQSVLAESYSNSKVIKVCETFDDDKTAYEQTKALLSEHQELNALYFCAGGIDGGIEAVKELGLCTKLKIVTVDDTDNIKEYLRQGIVNATVCQEPLKQGYKAVKIVTDKLLEDKNPIRKHIYTHNEVKLKYNLE